MRDHMNNITTKCIAALTLLVGCLLPIAIQADSGRGNHSGSGIVGQAYIMGGSWLNGALYTIPLQTRITVYELLPRRGGARDLSTPGKYVTDVETDENGNFMVVLKPGKYLLVPGSVPDLLTGNTILEVERNEYTTTAVVYGYMFVTN